MLYSFFSNKNNDLSGFDQDIKSGCLKVSDSRKEREVKIRENNGKSPTEMTYHFVLNSPGI